MRIAFIIFNFDRRKGGAERYVADFADYLAGRGHTVTVFCNRASPDDSSPHQIRIVNASRLKGYWRAVSFARNAMRLVSEDDGGFDVVQAFERVPGCDVYQPHSGVHLAQVDLTNNAYTCMLYRAVRRTLKLLSLKEYAHRNLEALIYTVDRPAAFVALSKMVARHMGEYYGLDKTLIELIYNGTDLDRFHPDIALKAGPELRTRYDIPEEEFLLLFVGLDYQRKGLAELFKAGRLLMKTYQRSDFRILVVGPPDAKYEKLAAALGIGPKVIFAGKTDEVEKYYAAADLLVLPTYYDPCPLVVFESLASGTPVVTTATNGAGEIISDGKEGYIVEDPGDSVALAEAVLATMDRPRLETMSVKARKLAEQYPISESYRKMEDLYLRVASEKANTGGEGE